MLQLTETPAWIWTSIETGKSGETIIEEMTEEFEVDPVSAENAADRFINMHLQEGILEGPEGIGSSYHGRSEADRNRVGRDIMDFCQSVTSASCFRIGLSLSAIGAGNKIQSCFSGMDHETGAGDGRIHKDLSGPERNGYRAPSTIFHDFLWLKMLTQWCRLICPPEWMCKHFIILIYECDNALFKMRNT